MRILTPPVRVIVALILLGLVACFSFGASAAPASAKNCLGNGYSCTDTGWIAASSVPLFLHPYDTGGAAPLTAIVGLPASAPGGWFANAPIDFSYTVQNTTATQIDASVIRVPVRGPHGETLDVNCKNGSKVSIAPGATFACNA